MILWFIAAFTAYFIKGLCGFANGLIFTTILGFGAPNASISPVNSLLGYKTLGLLTLGHIKTVLLLIPFALLGLFTGIKCCGHMDEKIVRRLTTALLILSGISLVLKNL